MKRLALLFGALISFYGRAVGYGDNVDTLLIWQERAVAVLTNACRMAPIPYRNRFIGNDGILLEENYPPVAPVYWNRELNAAARFHCVQMALDCGMTHTCNGIPFNERIREFYTASGTIGENIATGYRSPQDVVNGWLIDGRSAESAAPDKSGSDGHRANIMSSRFTELGCGYFIDATEQRARGYWCQDFGGGRSAYSYHPVCGLSHLFFSSDTITFMVNMYDTSETVAALTLELDGERLPLKLTMGNKFAGTWEVAVPAGSSCRQYAVEANYTDGTTLRYPEEGMLLTVGEGSCEESDSGNAVTMHAEGPHEHRNMVLMQCRNDRLVFTTASSESPPTSTEIMDCQGKTRYRHVWTSASIVSLSTRILPPGMWIIRHRLTNGSSLSARWINHR